MVALGSFQLEENSEQDLPTAALWCYCEVCEYKRKNLERVTTNFYHGFLIFPLWFWNFYLYIYSKARLRSDHQIDESVQRHCRNDITLSNNLEDGLIGNVLGQHRKTSVSFDRWIGWSAMAFLLLVVFLGLIVLLMRSSG